MKPKQKVTLRNLKSQPEVGKGMIGEVVSHPFHRPYTEVATTNVIAIKPDGTVETKNSIYTIIGD